MTNEEYKKEFQALKEGLVENLAIYHERVTLLIELTQFDINEKGVKFEARILKPLNKTQAKKNRLFEKMISKQPISFGASYQFGMGDSPLLKGKKVGRPYCPFTLWLDPELAIFVKENEDEITKQIPQFILMNEDWRQVVES